MEFVKLKRDDGILKRIYSIKNKQLFTNEDISILFPQRYIKANLMDIGRTVNVIGIFITIDKNNNYGLTKYPTMLSLTPAGMKDVDINGKVYKELLFKANTPVSENNESMPSTDLAYALLDDWLIRNGNIPFFVGYVDLLDIFLKFYSLTGTSLGSTITDVSTFISIIARDEKNNYLRENHNKKEILRLKQITYRGLTDVDKGYKNVASLLANGTYFDKGTSAALNMDNPESTDLGEVMSK